MAPSAVTTQATMLMPPYWASALGYQVVFRGFMLLLAGVPVYVFMKWRGARSEPTEAAEVATAPSDGEQPLGLTA